jgi:hypothetical protein
MTGTMVDLRCPGMGNLLGRAEAAATTVPGGVVELACWYCARARRYVGTPCVRVVHRFNLLGELLETEVIT